MTSSSKGLAGSGRVTRARGVAALAALAAVLAAGQSAAQPASDAPRIAASAEVSILGVDVVVTDRSGKPVHGLTAADFEVFHGGRPVSVSNFHEARALGESPRPAATEEAGAPGAGADVETVRPPRRIVVFVDRLYLPEPHRREQLFGGLKELLAKSLRPGDEAMIVSWGGYARIVRSFTGDLVELEATLDAVSRRVASLLNRSDELAGLASRDFWFGGDSVDPGVEPVAGLTEISRQAAALQAYGVMKAKVTALRGLVALMAGMEGRKSLVIVAHHFGRWPGGEHFVGPRGGITGVPRELDGLPPGSLRDGGPLLEELAAAANASGVTLYGVFPYDRLALDSAAVSAASGRRSAFGSRGDSIWMNEMAGLDLVAGRTGGTTAGHPSELPRFLDQVATDLDSYYSLGFPASGATKPAAVRVGVKREGLTARVRTTVAERTVEQQLTDRALANLFAPDENSRIGISVVAGEAIPDGKRYRIPVEIRIPVGALVRVPGPSAAQAKFSVFVVAATPNGDFSEVTRRRQEFEVKSGEESRADASHLTYTLEVESDAPAPRISLGVWDEIGGEAGFALVGRRKG